MPFASSTRITVTGCATMTIYAIAQDWQTPGGGGIMFLKGVSDERNESRQRVNNCPLSAPVADPALHTYLPGSSAFVSRQTHQSAATEMRWTRSVSDVDRPDASFRAVRETQAGYRAPVLAPACVPPDSFPVLEGLLRYFLADDWRTHVALDRIWAGPRVLPSSVGCHTSSALVTCLKSTSRASK